MNRLHLLSLFLFFYSGLLGQTDLIITGLIDGPLPGGTPKAIELYAVNDISDLSAYGLGSANNGDGSDGEEFTFPVISLNAGEFVYVASDSMGFNDFFGFYPEFNDGAANINGDDAIELFHNGNVVDIFGDINVDGTGEPWEHLDGWAYRVNATGPDGNTFQILNWFFSGVDALDGEMTNFEAAIPFPLGTYSPTGTSIINAVDDNSSVEAGNCVELDVLANDFVPGDLINIEIIEQGNDDNQAEFLQNDLLRYCASDQDCGYEGYVTYAITDDNGDSDTAIATFTITCPSTYPLYDIGDITSVDNDGIPDSIGVECSIIGIVYGVNLRSSGLQFTVIDPDRNGIAVFSFDDIDGYQVNEGDELLLKGVIDQFNGLTQMIPDSLEVISTGNPLVAPQTVTDLNEMTESSLIRLEGVQIVDMNDWTGSGSGFNVEVSDGTNNYTMRIDDQVDLYSMSPPSGLLNVTGIGAQFDPEVPYDDGYQILPRYTDDIEMITSVHTFSGKIKELKITPNPVFETIRIVNINDLESVQIINITGQVFLERLQIYNSEIQVGELPPGFYVLFGKKDGENYRANFVKH